MIDEVRLSKQIQDEIGYESPSPSFASPGYLSHRLAMRPDQHSRQHLRHERLLALVAALLAIVVVASLVWTAQALHSKQSVPVNKPRSKVGNALLPIAQAWFFSAEDGMVNLQTAPARQPSLPPSPVLLITHDGGRTWLRPTLNYVPAVVRWVDSQHLVAALYPDYFFTPRQLATSADGGSTWRITKVSFRGAPHNIFFLNSHEGWALCTDTGSCSGAQDAGQNALYHTLDSGAHWQQLGSRFASAGVAPEDLYFVDSNHGFMSTYNSDGVGRLFVTADGGRSWRVVELPAPPNGWQGADHSAATCQFTCVLLPAMFGKQGVLLVGRNDNWFTYTTNDGGMTWSDSRLVPVSGPTGFSFSSGAVDPRDWWILDCPSAASGQAPGAPPCDVAKGGLYRTADGGTTWQHLATTLPNGYSLVLVFPVGGDVLWGTASRAGLEYPVRSTDGGSTWSLVQLPAS